MGANPPARLANALAPGIPGRFRRQITQQRGEADPARARLRLKLVTHIVIQANGDRDTHENLC